MNRSQLLAIIFGIAVSGAIGFEFGYDVGQHRAATPATTAQVEASAPTYTPSSACRMWGSESGTAGTNIAVMICGEGGGARP
jgi:hypothetical protein